MNEVKTKILEQAFGVLKRQGNNSADGVFQFLRERKLLDEGTENIAKTALSGVKDPRNIDFGTFTQIVEKVAKEKGLDLNNISKKALGSLFGGSSDKPGEPSASAYEDDGNDEHEHDNDESDDDGHEDESSDGYPSTDDHETEED